MTADSWSSAQSWTDPIDVEQMTRFLTFLKDGSARRTSEEWSSLFTTFMQNVDFAHFLKLTKGLHECINAIVLECCASKTLIITKPLVADFLTWALKHADHAQWRPCLASWLKSFSDKCLASKSLSADTVEMVVSTFFDISERSGNDISILNIVWRQNMKLCVQFRALNGFPIKGALCAWTRQVTAFMDSLVDQIGKDYTSKMTKTSVSLLKFLAPNVLTIARAFVGKFFADADIVTMMLRTSRKLKMYITDSMVFLIEYRLTWTMDSRMATSYLSDVKQASNTADVILSLGYRDTALSDTQKWEYVCGQLVQTPSSSEIFDSLLFISAFVVVFRECSEPFKDMCRKNNVLDKILGLVANTPCSVLLQNVSADPNTDKIQDVTSDLVYSQVAFSLGFFLADTTTSDFPEVEKTVISTLLAGNDVVSSILSDAWTDALRNLHLEHIFVVDQHIMTLCRVMIRCRPDCVTVSYRISDLIRRILTVTGTSLNQRQCLSFTDQEIMKLASDFPFDPPGADYIFRNAITLLQSRLNLLTQKIRENKLNDVRNIRGLDYGFKCLLNLSRHPLLSVDDFSSCIKPWLHVAKDCAPLGTTLLNLLGCWFHKFKSLDEDLVRQVLDLAVQCCRSSKQDSNVYFAACSLLVHLAPVLDASKITHVSQMEKSVNTLFCILFEPLKTGHRCLLGIKLWMYHITCLTGFIFSTLSNLEIYKVFDQWAVDIWIRYAERSPLTLNTSEAKNWEWIPKNLHVVTLLKYGITLNKEVLELSHAWESAWKKISKWDDSAVNAHSTQLHDMIKLLNNV